MNRIKTGFTLLVLFMLASCAEDKVNQASLKMDAPDEFVIVSIQESSNGEYVCIGKTLAENLSVVLTYNSDLVLTNVQYPGENPKLAGWLTMTKLENENWIIGASTYWPIGPIGIFVTDKNFNVLHETHEYADIEYPKSIYEVKQLKNGDYLVVRDSVNAGSLILIKRYDAQLNTVFAASSFQNLDTTSGVSVTFNSPFTYELPDESIFYSVIREANGWKGVFPGPFFQIAEDDVLTGVLEKNGELRYKTNTPVEVTHVESIGLSYTGSHMMLNNIVNDEHLLYYTLIDPKDGEWIKSNQLIGNYRNHQHQDPFFGGHFPRGDENALPATLKPNQGHLIFSEEDNQLIFMGVDADANLTPRFLVFLPPFDEMLSYRQHFAENGNIIIGVSYRYKGKIYFNIQELTMSGEIVE